MSYNLYTYIPTSTCLREREQVETNLGGCPTGVGRSAGDLKVLKYLMIVRHMLKHDHALRDRLESDDEATEQPHRLTPMPSLALISCFSPASKQSN